MKTVQKLTDELRHERPSGMLSDKYIYRLVSRELIENVDYERQGNTILINPKGEKKIRALLNLSVARG